MDNEQVVDQTQAPETQEQDLRATLTSALAEAKSRQSEQIETQEEKKDRLRDEHGRFARSQQETLDAKPKVDTKTVEKPLDLGATPQTVEMPKTWNTAAKGYWDKLSGHWVKLPPEVQQLIEAREVETHKGFTRHDEERAFGREMYKAVQPFLGMIQAEGGTPVRAVSSLMQTAALLRQGSPEQKSQAIQNLCRAFNVALPGADGKIAEPNAEVAELRRQLSQLQQSIQQGRLREQQEAQSTIQSEIEKFASDPAHKHFEAVKPHMAALLKGGVAQDLKQAYEMAVWAHPELKEQLLAEQKREAEQKLEEERKAKIEAAKRKVSSIPGAPGNTQSVRPNGSDRSLRDEIKASMAEASGRL